ncbi:MAG: NfeD family protein [Myxococcota bacterium]
MPSARADAPCVMEATLEGVVNAGTADYLASAVRAAEERKCGALLVTIDTPGGMLDETRRIVRSFLGADVPVVTYVAPSGAHAGSAGVFITLAGHVAAMAPGTNIGAAHPVSGAGQDPEESGGEHMARKVENDTAAFARSVAEQRGRNADWAEKAVRESVSITAGEAVELDVVDHVVPSNEALLEAIDGTELQIGGRAVVLETAGATIAPHAMTIRQRAQTILGHPTLAYVLLMIGALGIMIEVYNPGLIVPGAIGAFALLLAAIGLNALPVNIGAVVLVLVAFGLFVAEAFTPTFGLLTAGGLVSLLVGAALLVDESDPGFFAEPSVAVSWGAVVPLALVITAGALALAWNAARVQRQASPTGREGLVGARGRTVTEVGPGGGAIHIQGERWNATAAEPIAPDTPVRVLSVRGLELEVEPTEG